MVAESKEFEISTLCFPSETKHDWPSSEFGCYIQLMTQTESLAGFENSINLDLVTDSSWIVSHVSEDDDYVANHLPFIEYEIIESLDDHPKLQRMCVTYIVYLKQNQSYFRMLFRAPLFVALICLCLATATSKMVRFGFISVGFVVLCISMMSLTGFTPTFYKSTFGKFHFHGGYIDIFHQNRCS